MSARSALRLRMCIRMCIRIVVVPAVAECEARVRRPIVQLEGLLVVSPMYSPKLPCRAAGAASDLGWAGTHTGLSARSSSCCGAETVCAGLKSALVLSCYLSTLACSCGRREHLGSSIPASVLIHTAAAATEVLSLPPSEADG